MLADLLYYSGDEGAALRIADEVIERADAGTDRALALALSSLYVATKVARFDQARTEAGDDLALQARIGLMEAATLGQAGDWHGRAARLDETLEAARGSGDDALIAQTLTMTAWSVMFMVDDKGSRDRARAELVEALQIEERLPASAHAPAIWSPKTKLGICAMYDEELDDARRMLADERARAVEHGDDWSLNGVLCFASEVERRAGRCKRAHDLALQSYQVAERNADPQGRAVALVHLALIQALLGPLADARATAARAKTAAEEIGDRFFAAQGRAAAGLIALCVGDHAMVLHEVGTMPEELRAFGRRYDIESPHAAAIGDEIEARIALGDLEAARRRIDELCERACRLGRARPLGVAQRGRGLLLAAEGRTPEALEAFEASLAVFDNIQAPFECARTLLAFGTVQRRAKRRRAARESLQAAVAILEEIGAAPWAQKARAELARIGGRARGGDELTATERRVAELVAEGRTNREVAAALFVTPRTVEWNLTKIYAKLHVRSRAELTRRLSEPNLLNH
jgi:DNA-binding NarL/FixJ family response regulator